MNGSSDPPVAVRSSVDEARSRVRSARTELRGEPRSPARLVYLDNIKTYLIVGIIAAHAVMGYSTFGSWTYQVAQEVTISPLVEIIFTVAAVSLGGLFMMALFFLVSGLLTQDSLERKGESRFVRDRVLRLGVPFVIYTLVVWPLLEYAVIERVMHLSYWRSFTNTDPILDTGPMWFVGVLLLFSLALVMWRKVRPASQPSNEPLTWRRLVLLFLLVATPTFLIRLVLPADSNQILNSHLWAWPEYIAMFALGVTASRRGWLRPVPAELARRCGIATLIAIAAVGSSVVLADPLGLTENAFYGGWGLPALLAAASEGVLAVAAPIWVLAFAQRHLNRTGGLRRAMARGSYMAFMLQGPVLVGLELALRPFGFSGDVKALVVVCLGVVLSFSLAWVLVKRTAIGRYV